MKNKKKNSKNIIESDFGSTRAGFGKALIKLGRKKEIVVLSADLTSSLKADKFKEKFSNQFFEMGICEQNMMSCAAGMAITGKIPFVLSYSAFNPGRNWDQLRVSVAYSNLNVKIIGGHSGLTTGPDGATHQMLEDIAITNVLPNMTIIVPCDQNQAEQATLEIAKLKGPCYLRLSREKSKNIISKNDKFELGKAQILKRGSDITIFSTGLTVQFAIEAHKKLLEKGYSSTIVNIHTIKPIDEKTIISLSKKTPPFLVVEEHQKNGGLTSIISQLTSSKNPVLIDSVSVDDCFGQSGEGYELLEEYGISTEQIVKKAEKLILKNKLF